MNIAGNEVRALRLSFVGELGWELHIPNDGAVDVHKAVMDAGKQYGIVNAGYRSIESVLRKVGWHLYEKNLINILVTLT